MKGIQHSKRNNWWSGLQTFLSLKGTYIKWDQMNYCIGMSQIMKEKESLMKHMEEWREDVMQEEKLRRGSYELGYGGQLCIRIPRITIGHVMFVSKWAGHREGMNFL